MNQSPAKFRLDRRFFAGICALSVAIALAWPVSFTRADELPAPTGKVLLVIKGAITRTNAGKEARFDRAALESLGFSELVTTTAWHPKETRFEGILARKLMQAVGATGKTVTAVAANDYRVKIPIEDFMKYDVLLATRIDGKQLRLRTKGPIWVIYPDDTGLAPLVRQERMIWQLTEFDIE